MASSAENRAVNLAGLVQGITLVTFPAARSIFTDPSEYDLSNTQYGAMFVPQVLTAIATSLLGASTTQAALALTAFWAMVTVGRLLIAALPDGALWRGVAAFGLAGLGCSAFLPLTISLGQDTLTTMSAAVAGGVIAFYQVGCGIAAFGVGPLVDGGTSLSTIYGWTAVAAAGLALLSFAVTRRQPSPQPATSPG
jgi:MFS family permease